MRTIRAFLDESFHALQRFFNTDLSLDGMLSRIKDMAQKLPPLIGQIVCFGTLVGPRATELFECFMLMKDDQTFQKYYDPEHMTLCHYKFHDIFFVRRIKKIIFLSFATPSCWLRCTDIWYTSPLSDDNLQRHQTHASNRMGIACDLQLSSKVFASHPPNEGIQPERVYMLQERVSQ